MKVWIKLAGCDYELDSEFETEQDADNRVNEIKQSSNFGWPNITDVYTTKD